MIEPDALLTKVEKLDGTDGRKMSKSYGNTIHLTEDTEILSKKVMSMITDPARIHPTDKGHPEVCTVFSYHRVFSEREFSDIELKCKSGEMGCVQCKKALFEKLENIISPIRDKYKHYMDNPKIVNKILEEGNALARKTAKDNLGKFRKAMGYV
jgi:tryptophanyl-tRNA synthetase